MTTKEEVGVQETITKGGNGRRKSRNTKKESTATKVNIGFGGYQRERYEAAKK